MNYLKKVNFGTISDVVSIVMDRHVMDIGRRMVIRNPDGSMGETNPDQPLYENIPCNIEITSADNPDPATIDVMPIVKSLTIFCSLDIDLKNGDTIWAKILSDDGELLEEYKGIIGFPSVSQSRKSVTMAVRTL